MALHSPSRLMRGCSLKLRTQLTTIPIIRSSLPPGKFLDNIIQIRPQPLPSKFFSIHRLSSCGLAVDSNIE
jgi:hypothetical protein